MKKTLPKIKNDKDAEFLLEKDLSDLLIKDNFKRVSFEFKPKDQKINLRISDSLLKIIKKKAAQASMPYQKYIRLVLEKEIEDK